MDTCNARRQTDVKVRGSVHQYISVLECAVVRLWRKCFMFVFNTTPVNRVRHTCRAHTHVLMLIKHLKVMKPTRSTCKCTKKQHFFNLLLWNLSLSKLKPQFLSVSWQEYRRIACPTAVAICIKVWHVVCKDALLNTSVVINSYWVTVAFLWAQSSQSSDFNETFLPWEFLIFFPPFWSLLSNRRRKLCSIKSQ